MTISRKFDEDDTEGHKFGGGPKHPKVDEDDTEGHVQSLR